MDKPWWNVLENFKPGVKSAHTESMLRLTGGLYSDTTSTTLYYDSSRNKVGKLCYLWMGADGFPLTFQLRGLDNREWLSNRSNLSPAPVMWDGTPFIDHLCHCDRPVLKEDYLCQDCRDSLVS